MSRKFLALMGALILTAGLGGCGKVGQLERPGPLFGAGRNTERQADDTQKKVQDPSRPVDTIDPRDRTMDASPPRTLPIPDASSSASNRPPQTAMPDPYINPR